MCIYILTGEARHEALLEMVHLIMRGKQCLVIALEVSFQRRWRRCLCFVTPGNSGGGACD